MADATITEIMRELKRNIMNGFGIHCNFNDSANS